MPYLRITCPDVSEERRRLIADRLTVAINDLFFNPHAKLTRDDLRERTTIHFAPYTQGYLFIGGRTPSERGIQDVTIELSDRNMTVRHQQKVYHSFDWSRNETSIWVGLLFSSGYVLYT